MTTPSVEGSSSSDSSTAAAGFKISSSLLTKEEIEAWIGVASGKLPAGNDHKSAEARVAWQWFTPVEATLDVQVQLRQLKNLFEDATPKLESLKERADIELWVAVYLETDTPAIAFDQDVVQWIARVSNSFVIDVYP